MSPKIPTLNFAEMLDKIERGELVSDLTIAQSELVRALVQTEGARGGRPKGKITLTLTYQYDGEMLEISPVIAVAKPKAVRNRAVLFVTEGDQVSFQNPTQMPLALGESVPAALAPVMVPATTAPVHVPEPMRIVQ